MWKIAVQINVVFVHATQPRHPIWIQDVNNDDSNVTGKLPQISNKLKLDGGPSEPFDPVLVLFLFVRHPTHRFAIPLP